MKEFKLKSGKIFRVVKDQHYANPRQEWDNIGIVACFHTKYRLTDKDIPFKFEDFNGWKEMEAHIKNELKAVACLPVYMYDHSGQTVSTKPFSDKWDSGQIGFIYTTEERLIKFNILQENVGMTDELKENVPNYLQGEIETWNDYITGNVWGYQVVTRQTCNLGHEHEEVGDSCWGFFGNIEDSGILDNVPEGDEIIKEEKNG